MTREVHPISRRSSRHLDKLDANQQAGHDIISKILEQSKATKATADNFARVSAGAGMVITVASVFVPPLGALALGSAVPALVSARASRASANTESLKDMGKTLEEELGNKSFLGQVYNAMDEKHQKQFDHITISKRAGICEAILKSYDGLFTKDKDDNVVPPDKGMQDAAAQAIAHFLTEKMDSNIPKYKMFAGIIDRLNGHNVMSMPFSGNHQRFKEIDIGNLTPTLFHSKKEQNGFEASIDTLSGKFTDRINAERSKPAESSPQLL